jgi:hypothetical protein
MMFEGVPQFWRQHQSLEALQEQGIELSEEEAGDLWSVLRPALREPEQKWMEIIARMSVPTLDMFRELLKENHEDAARVASLGKIAQISIVAAMRRLSHPDRPPARTTRIDGPLYVYLFRSAEAHDPFRPRLSYRQLGKMFGVSDKTAKRWEERMVETGAPVDGRRVLVEALAQIVQPMPRRERRPP